MIKRVPRISRRAWLLAQQNQIDVFSVVPSGADGRIVEEDILRLMSEDAVRAYKESMAPAPKPATAEEIAEKAAEEARQAEEARIAEEARKAEEARLAEEARKAEEARLAEEARKAEEARLAEEARKAEEARLAEEARKAEEARVAEEARKAEEARVAEEARKAEEARIAEEARKAEEARIAEEAEEKAKQTAIVASVPNEEPVEDENEEPICEKVHSCNTGVYPHTDVIIPATATAPDGTPMTVSMSFDASSIMRLHTMIKQNGEAMGVSHVTVNDMILFATAKLLKKNKALNAHFLGDKIRYFEGVHLGFAIDTNHGMEIPTVFDAEKLSLYALAQITNALTKGARAGKIPSEKTKPCASFTVSDLGKLGVEYFTPSLKAPQTGVLGVCALQRKIKEVDGKDVFYSCIPLSLTFDPRALDTTSAAKFLRELCVSLENFELLLFK